jgi:16S rRNA (guanine966-N2)-methyltransferase
MRIIAGKWRGTVLDPPRGPQTRPVLDQVKEAVFNILGSRMAMPGELPPCRVLDLFAGTGSFGLEALSRGAEACTFVETHRPTAALLKSNISRLGAEPLCTVLMRDVWRCRPSSYSSSEPNDLIFLDPPYRDVERDSRECARLLSLLAADGILHPDGVIIARHPKRCYLHEVLPPGTSLLDQRSYGGMTITFVVPGGCSQS